jgi:hypothetical protein
MPYGNLLGRVRGAHMKEALLAEHPEMSYCHALVATDWVNVCHVYPD